MNRETVEGIQCEFLDDLDIVADRPSRLLDVHMHYCPGCGHSVVHRLLMEVVQELHIRDKTVGIAPVG